MRNQKEMFNFLKERVTTHTISVEENKIIGKSLIKSRSFSSFKITYLKNSEQVSVVAGRGRAMRYSNEEDLFSMMGAFTQIRNGVV